MSPPPPPPPPRHAIHTLHTLIHTHVTHAHTYTHMHAHTHTQQGSGSSDIIADESRIGDDEEAEVLNEFLHTVRDNYNHLQSGEGLGLGGA